MNKLKLYVIFISIRMNNLYNVLIFIYDIPTEIVNINEF